VSVVDLPSDDLKGRIIGREGRNIRALEQATGVDLIVDDTPGAIILSGSIPTDARLPSRRSSACIADGRIHPARIEEVVEKVKAEMEEVVRKDGEAAAFELGMHDLHPELQKLMGRLKYRTSYGQNVLNHSKEVAYLAGNHGEEIGLNAHVAVRAAFLHDCGKAIDRELQGTHLQIGIDLLRKYGESEPVVMAMAAHHMDIDWPSLEAMIVQAADAISAARPGARRDILESYVKRLESSRRSPTRSRGCPKLSPCRPAVRIRNHGRKRTHLGRRSGLAVERHRQTHRERARIPRPHQGNGHSRNACRRVRKVIVVKGSVTGYEGLVIGTDCCGYRRTCSN
jgi:ribonuclease Y